MIQNNIPSCSSSSNNRTIELEIEELDKDLSDASEAPELPKFTLEQMETKIQEKLDAFEQSFLKTVETTIRDVAKSEFAKAATLMSSIKRHGETSNTMSLLPSMDKDSEVIEAVDNAILEELNTAITTEEGVQKLETELASPIVVTRYVSYSYITDVLMTLTYYVTTYR